MSFVPKDDVIKEKKVTMRPVNQSSMIRIEVSHEKAKHRSALLVVSENILRHFRSLGEKSIHNRQDARKSLKHVAKLEFNQKRHQKEQTKKLIY